MGWLWGIYVGGFTMIASMLTIGGASATPTYMLPTGKLKESVRLPSSQVHYWVSK